MPVILKNNAFSTLATAITTSDTGIVVASGSQFPTISAGEYFYATLVSQAGTTEIIKVTARVGNSMTVVRAQDGSTAATFQAGTLVEMRVNAASMTDLVDEHDQASEISIADAGGYYVATQVEGALQEAGAILQDNITRANVATLLADTSLTYTAGNPNSIVVGDVVRTRTEGFAYGVAASGATDQQVTTVGNVKLYARPVDAPFYASSIHTFDVSGATDERANVQGAIDFARANGKRHLTLPAGTLLINGTLVVGNTGSGFHTLHIEGANGSFLGTTLLLHAPGQVLNPMFNIVGTRMFRMTDIRMNGNNPAPALRNGENFRDSVYANWITPGVSAGRYNPYAGIAFSALYGTDPGAGNNYTFGSYGQNGLASKAFFERVRIESFVVGAVLAPNAGAPGIEDIMFRDSSFVENTYGICTTGTQQRNVLVENCNIIGSWTFFDNVTFGTQQGQPVYARGCNLGKAVMSVQTAPATGASVTRDCYFENVRGLGISGSVGSGGRFYETFDGCNMSFIGHDDDGTEEQKDIPLVNNKTLDINNSSISCNSLLLAAPNRPITLRSTGIRCENTVEQATWGFYTSQSIEYQLSLENCEMRAYSGPTRYINDVERVNTIASRALIGRNTREIVQLSNGRRYRITRHPASILGPNISGIVYDSKDQLSFSFTVDVTKPIAVNDLIYWRVFVPGVNNARAGTSVMPALRITNIVGTAVTCKILAHIDTTYLPTTAEVAVQNFVNATTATGDTTNGSADIVNVTSVGNFLVGDWITFNNPSFVSYARIIGISGTTITCNRTLNVTATAEPVFNALLTVL